MDLSRYTTLHLGGPAERLVTATTEAELLHAVAEADGAGAPLLLLAGGSNLVVADAGVRGTVVRVLTSGVRRDGDVLEAAAGESWDALVAASVADGLAGIECLAGIPGSVGATPIQNVGAYGQEVADVITGVRALDRTTGVVVELDPAACAFAYRSSAFKRDPGRFVVLSVRFALHAGGRSQPIRYAELARALDVGIGDRVDLAAARAAVLGLRRAKGMVLDPGDPDTASAGSFFTNPILTGEAFAALAARAQERLGEGARPPAFPEADGRVKTSAAWLIERAGFRRGHGDPAGIAISSKHVLALTNRGAGTTAALVALAREIAAGVHAAFGVVLVPEPVFAGHAWR
ncbi:UDP-N-acetylmuramate dehydrogenase [Baekduia soli]|uniref:UDP-N-acetylmuramate dehydrogenase n=1 Tax=Baekduia soli TaxID=496014 RepID=UPI001E4D0247|nr:UDP-N-acetylmuramate dehydrogenase [Baekduia soli]